jgi:hypothetical protein
VVQSHPPVWCDCTMCRWNCIVKYFNPTKMDLKSDLHRRRKTTTTKPHLVKGSGGELTTKGDPLRHYLDLGGLGIIFINTIPTITDFILVIHLFILPVVIWVYTCTHLIHRTQFRSIMMLFGTMCE